MIATTEAISERIMHERADCAAESGGDGEGAAEGGEEVASTFSSSSIGSIEEFGGRGGRPIGAVLCVRGLKCQSKTGSCEI